MQIELMLNVLKAIKNMRTGDNPKKGKTTNDLQKLMILNAVKNQGYENVMDSLKFAGISPLNPYAEGVYHY